MSLILNPLETSIVAIGVFKALQKPHEFAALLNIADIEKVETILEIGVGNGGTSWAWTKLSSLKNLTVIDLPEGPWGGNRKETLEKSFDSISSNAPHVQVKAIWGNSQNSECLQAVKDSLGGGKIDLLFIDGAHDYAGVKTDFLTYSSLVREGGVIAFHDILKHPPETLCEVERFWSELKETLPPEKYVELVQEPVSWGGIAVVKWEGLAK